MWLVHDMGPLLRATFTYKDYKNAHLKRETLDVLHCFLSLQCCGLFSEFIVGPHSNALLWCHIRYLASTAIESWRIPFSPVEMHACNELTVSKCTAHTWTVQLGGNKAVTTSGNIPAISHFNDTASILWEMWLYGSVYNYLWLFSLHLNKNNPNLGTVSE